MSTTKFCKNCNEEKDISFFRIQKKKYGNWINTICRNCEVEKGSKRYYAKKGIPKKVQDLEGEIWKDIEGFEGVYNISSFERIKSLSRKVKAINAHSYRTISERILKPYPNIESDYYYVTLNANGIEIKATVHSLMAKAFIPNPENKPQVNHKNKNRRDNRIENLEWVTSLEDAQHKLSFIDAWRPEKGEKNKLSKEIIIIHPDGFEEKAKGISEVGRRLGTSFSASISNVLRGKSKSYKGYKFKYA